MLYDADWFEAMCIDGDRAWIALAEVSVFCECSYPEFEVKRVIEFPEEVRGIQRAFYMIKKYKDCLCFIPLKAKYVMLYDLSTEKVRLISTECLKPEKKEDRSENSNYITAYWVNDKLHMHTIDTQKYMILDMDTLEVSCNDNLYVEADTRLCYQKCVELDSGRGYSGNDYWFWAANDNHLTEWNCDTGESRTFCVGKAGEAFRLCMIDGSDCWLIQNDTEENVVIVSYNPESNKTNYYPVLDTKGTKYCHYGCAKKMGVEVFFFPSGPQGGSVISLNTVSKEIRKVFFDDMGIVGYVFSSYLEHGEYIYMCEWNTGKLVEIDKENIKRRRLISLSFGVEQEKIIMRNYMEKAEVVHERRKRGLNNLIAYIQSYCQ